MNKNEEYKPVFYEDFQTAALNITRREWFAGMALQGALSRGVEGVEVERIASDSFLMADAMVQAGKGENR